jgi:LPS-assembly lipoprotein
MSSSDRRTFMTLLAALPLAACGYVPAYGPQGAATALRNRIRLNEPSSKNEFDFVARVESRLGRAQDPIYRLGFTIGTKVIKGGYTPSNSITRYQLNGSAVWVLTDIVSGATVADGRVENFTSWSATGSTIAGLTAEEDAAYRLMQILADQVVTQIVAKSSDLAQ